MTFDEVMVLSQHTGPQVVLFYGAACAPCQRLKPVLRQVLADLGRPPLAELNVASELSAARALGLRSVPAVALVTNDTARVLFTGERSVEDIRALLGERSST